MVLLTRSDSSQENWEGGGGGGGEGEGLGITPSLSDRSEAGSRQFLEFNYQELFFILRTFVNPFNL